MGAEKQAFKGVELEAAHDEFYLAAGRCFCCCRRRGRCCCVGGVGADGVLSTAAQDEGKRHRAWKQKPA